MPSPKTQTPASGYAKSLLNSGHVTAEALEYLKIRQTLMQAKKKADLLMRLHLSKQPQTLENAARASSVFFSD